MSRDRSAPDEPGSGSSSPFTGATILGIDPGSRITGYAALCQRGRELTVLESGVFALRVADPHAARLGDLQQRLELLIDRVQPSVAAVEDIFTHKNARSALLLGQARGAVLAALGRRGLPVEAYPPATVKRTVAGHGRASKEQIQRMVQVLLGLEASPRADEADAMAVAICHAMIARLRQGQRTAARAPHVPSRGRRRPPTKIRRW